MTNDQQAYALWLETLPDLYAQLEAQCAEHERQLAKQQAAIDRLRAELTYARADRDGWSDLYRKVRKAAEAAGGES